MQDAGLLEKARVGLAQKARSLLVPHVDHAYLLRAARGLHELHRPAHDVEQVIRALFLERFRENF
jgi:hypothetical protein